MIILAAALQMIYSPPSRAFEAHARQCDVAVQHLQTFIGQSQSFITDHETDSGGTLSSDEGVELRGAVDAIARPYLRALDELREDPAQADCEETVEAAKDAITNRLIAPVFARAHGYHYVGGRWKR